MRMQDHRSNETNQKDANYKRAERKMNQHAIYCLWRFVMRLNCSMHVSYKAVAESMG